MLIAPLRYLWPSKEKMLTAKYYRKVGEKWQGYHPESLGARLSEFPRTPLVGNSVNRGNAPLHKLFEGHIVKSN
jgi:hypothetical protein